MYLHSFSFAVIQLCDTGVNSIISSALQMGVVCGLYGGAVTNLGSPEQVQRLYVPVTVSVKYHT